MPVDAQMQYLGTLNGKKCYWAAEGKFETPGLHYWDEQAQHHVHVPLDAKADHDAMLERVVARLERVVAREDKRPY